jgi:hypothetical protein
VVAWPAQLRSPRRRLARRIFLHRSFHGSNRRGCSLALGQHLPRSPRLRQPCSAANFDPSHFSRQPGCDRFPDSSTCFRRKPGFSRAVSRRGERIAGDIRLPCAVCGDPSTGSSHRKHLQLLRHLCPHRHPDVRAALFRLPQDFPLRARSDSRRPSDSALHQLRSAFVDRSTAPDSAFAGPLFAFSLVSRLVPVASRQSRSIARPAGPNVAPRLALHRGNRHRRLRPQLSPMLHPRSGEPRHHSGNRPRLRFPNILTPRPHRLANSIPARRLSLRDENAGA